MKTILQALIDDLQYPIPIGLIENKLMVRGLDGENTFSADIAKDFSYMGAYADCLFSLIETPNITEADKTISFSNNDKSLILKKVNAIYNAIGEDEVELVDKPMVYFGG